MNGVKVNGQVKGFDSYIIMLEDEKVKGCDSAALAMGDDRTVDPIVIAANALPANFFKSTEGLLEALFASKR